MNCVEIILKDIKKQYLDEIIEEVLKFNVKDIISSHFYDKERDKDIEFQDVGNFEDFFNTAGTGNLFLEKVMIGTEIEKVLIIISCDEELVDITLNFDEGQFEKYKSLELNDEMRKLFLKLFEIQKNYSISTIAVGYEPAADDDMKIVEFRHGQVKICNEQIQSQFARSCCNILTQTFL